MNVTQSMQFAINFSHSAAQLFQTGRLALDRFKTPNWPDMVAEAGQYTPAKVLEVVEEKEKLQMTVK